MAESDESLKKRNAEFWNWGKLITETVECYGTPLHSSNINIYDDLPSIHFDEMLHCLIFAPLTLKLTSPTFTAHLNQQCPTQTLTPPQEMIHLIHIAAPLITTLQATTLRVLMIIMQKSMMNHQVVWIFIHRTRIFIIKQSSISRQ